MTEPGHLTMSNSFDFNFTLDSALNQALSQDFTTLLSSPPDVSFTSGKNWQGGDDWDFQAVVAGKGDTKHDEDELSPGTSDKSSKSNLPTTPTPTATPTPTPTPLALSIPINGKAVLPQQDFGGVVGFDHDSQIYMRNLDLEALYPFEPINPEDIELWGPPPQIYPGLSFPQPIQGQAVQQRYFAIPSYSNSASAPTAQRNAVKRHSTPSPATPRRSPRFHPRLNYSTSIHEERLASGSSTDSLLIQRPPPPIVFQKKKIEHKRGLKNAENNRPQDIYEARPPRTKWGPFRYQDLGVELYPLLYLSSEQIADFLTNREANKTRRLTIWIQNAPAQINNRYHMGTNSSKCRWDKCPGPKNTILKGFWRVAFDEDSDKTGKKYDPFLNAAYMHLYCFEECFNLGFMINVCRYLGFDIQPDVREFRYETRNPMSLVRDHAQLLEVYNRYFAHERARYPFLADDGQVRGLSRKVLKKTAFSPANDVPACKRLWSLLTEAHLGNEISTRHKAREARGGAHIGEHKGDLRRYAQLKRFVGVKVESPPAESYAKRKRNNDDLDGESEDKHRFSRPRHSPTEDGELDWDDDLFGDRTHQLLRQPLPPRPTRRTSTGKSDMIADVLASPTYVTRRTSQALQKRLNLQPRFIQEQVLASIPEHLQVIFDDGLPERVARLPMPHRAEVHEFVRRREMGRDPRHLSSI